MASAAELVSAGGILDRDAETRMQEQLLDAAWGEPNTLILRIAPGGRLPIAQYEDRQGLDLVEVRGARDPEYFYLGRVRGVALFCVAAEPDSDDERYPEPEGGWQHPFVIGGALSSLEIEVMTVALALVNWHASMPLSARDGGQTAIAQGGWARIDAQGGEHFPRTDPAVIVLVEHGDRVLLGSNVLWETGRFSLLAGFVEAGESAEQAVLREVQEEAGVPLENVRYVSSQPWPFPRSLMLGYRASLAAGADPEALCPDPTEISELRWFTRAELRHPSPELKLPGTLSIARALINLWVAEGDSEQ
ncbi:MAG: NAD(+) diphosphatase [Actinobacteria bacterium]|jgi:NAD+ diphosphatase|nr:NAD(+) diphosphatase [Actinomycetota bacterium]